MNIITADGSKIKMIKGWELVGERVLDAKAIQLNQVPTTMYFTAENFYLYLNKAWYNGDIADKNDSSLDINRFLSESISFSTARAVTFELPEMTDPKLKASKLIKDTTPSEEKVVTKSEAEPEVMSNVVAYERVDKKTAVALIEDGGANILLCKVNRKVSLEPNDTLTSVNNYLGKKGIITMEDVLEKFFADKKANKSNTVFFKQI